MYWIGLAIIAGGLLFLLASGESGAFGMRQGDFAGVIYGLALLILVGGGILARYKGKLNKMSRDIALWLCIFLAIGVGYSYRFELKNVYDRFTGNLMSSSSPQQIGSSASYAVSRDNNGHYSVKILTNNKDVTYLVDTGASRVVITDSTARNLGFDPNQIGYTRMISTANGVTQAAPVELTSMRIGDIQVNNVSAFIARPDDLDENLLGMSFLNKLSSYHFKEGQLIFSR